MGGEPSIQVINLWVEVGRILFWEHMRTNIDTGYLMKTVVGSV